MKNAGSVMRSVRVLAVAFAAGIGLAHAGDVRVRFEVPEPFRVGTHSYERGVISVQALMSYNPTTSLLEIRVNGECIGMVTARRDVPDAPPARPEAMFRRDEDGRLVMIGYQVAGAASGTSYRFQDETIAQAPLATAALGSF